MFIARSAWRLAIALVLPLGVAQGQAETIQVVIDKLVFTPATITATVGDTIEWINKDPIVHTATVKDAWEVMIPPRRRRAIKSTSPRRWTSTAASIPT